MPDSSDLQTKQLLSLHVQPAWLELIKAVGSHDLPVTLVVGAGVSMDAGLPSWADLVRRIGERNLGKRQDIPLWDRILADPSDLIRKTESILELSLTRAAKKTRGKQPEAPDLLANALYKDIDGDPRPGQLAQAVALLALRLGHDTRIITTNFDGVVEAALNVASKRDVASPHSLEEVKFDDDSGVATWATNQGVASVLHLHGYVPARGETKGPVILAESHFLEHGPMARRVILDALRRTITIFIGVSVNDPNLTGPLWDIRNAASKAQELSGIRAGALSEPSGDTPPPPELRPSYIFIVPDQSPHTQSLGDPVKRTLDDRSYMLEKSKYLSSKLGLRPVYLKSYSQLTQAVSELSLATTVGSAYIANPEVRYGRRLSAALETAYVSLGCARTSDLVTGTSALQVSARLDEGLRGATGRAGIQAWLSRQRKAERRLLVQQRASEDKIRELLPLGEEFGLYLWLRSRQNSFDASDRYSLQLVGSSVVTHQHGHTIPLPQVISNDSTYPAVDAVYTGNLLSRSVPTTRDAWGETPTVWGTQFAVPVRCNHSIELDDGSVISVPMIVGVITLNSKYSTDKAKKDQPPRPRSILATLTPERSSVLGEKLEKLALEIFNL